MIVVRSFAFNAAFYLWTTVIVVAMLPVLAMPQGAVLAVGRLWSRSNLWLLRAIVGLTCEVRGTEHMAPSGVIYAFKHQSALETIVLPRLLPNVAAVLKRELMWIPLFGWYLTKFGAIPIHRGKAGAALRRMVRAAKAFAEAGRPLMVAPEGTRRPPGAPPRYLPGIAALYDALDLPVVPVAVNTGLYWPRRGFVKRPGRAVIAFLPPIPPGLDRRAFLAELGGRLEPACDRLLEEARSGDGPAA